MAVSKVFAAYPSVLPQLGHTISAAIDELRQYTSQFEVDAWPEIDIAGRFIVEGILDKINDADFVVADITRLNFNVTFEVGYAIGRGKRVIPI
jgi:nucleoside 2-deoxyribosyltransferase